MVRWLVGQNRTLRRIFFTHPPSLPSPPPSVRPSGLAVFCFAQMLFFFFFSFPVVGPRARFPFLFSLFAVAAAAGGSIDRSAP